MTELRVQTIIEKYNLKQALFKKLNGISKDIDKINVKKDEIEINLSEEHCDYKWVTKDSEYLDDFIRDKLKNI